MIFYKNDNGDRCLRLGSENAGIQLSFGYFSHSRPCSVALNGNDTVYTGKCQSDGEDPMFKKFPTEFSEAPLAVATPYVGKYWFGDVAATATTLSRVDFFMNEKHTKSNKISVGGNYIVIGKYGSTDAAEISAALATDDVRAYWKEGSNVIRILVPGLDYAIQLISGSISGTGSFTQMNSSLYRATIKMADTETYSEVFSGYPVMVVTPSMKCRAWNSADTFAHPYWFGGVNADQTHIEELDVYSNSALSSQSIYGRYIAVGRSSATVTDWTEVPVSLEYDTDTHAYALRFGNEEGGVQLAFGEINFSDRKIQKPLNDVTSNIYTAFKEAPAYDAEQRTDGQQKMYFPRAFCESPSTMIVAAQPCRDTDDKTFLHPYWFGDAASDAVSIFNTDLYTNAQFKTDQDVYAKYLAVGRYSAKADWARDFILKALSYKGVKKIDGDSIGNYFLKRYEDLTGKQQTNVGWCSEFASVTLNDAKAADGMPYPYRASVLAFTKKFSASKTDPQLYIAVEKSVDGEKTIVFEPATVDDTLNESNHYGRVRSSDGKDFRFSCTEISSTPAQVSAHASMPETGDLIFFDTSAACHTGIVINTNGSRVFTVEGNVSMEESVMGTDTAKTVIHRRRKISVQHKKASETSISDDKMVGVGKVYELSVKPNL